MLHPAFLHDIKLPFCLTLKSNCWIIVKKQHRGEKMDFQYVLNSIVNWLTTEGLKIVFGLFVLFVFFKLVNGISRRSRKNMMLFDFI